MTDAPSPQMQPFFYIKHGDALPSDQAIYSLLRSYPELPTHYIVELLDRDYATCGNRLAQLSTLGSLHRFDPKRKISKHSSYSLKERGYKDTKTRAHRIGECILKASTQIGVMGTKDFEYIGWRDMLLLPSMPRDTIRTIDNGTSPHIFDLSKGKLIPDGDPSRIYHKPSNKHINLLDEFDRDTEPLTTKAARRSILEKYEKYNELFHKQLYKERYGFTNCLVRFVTNSEERKRAMIRLYEDNFKASRFILFATFKEDPYDAVTYPKPDGQFFTTAYERVGHSPFKLDRFWE